MKDSNTLKKLLKDILEYRETIKQRLLYMEDSFEESRFLDDTDIQALVSEFVNLTKMMI